MESISELSKISFPLHFYLTSLVLKFTRVSKVKSLTTQCRKSYIYRVCEEDSPSQKKICVKNSKAKEAKRSTW